MSRIIKYLRHKSILKTSRAVAIISSLLLVEIRLGVLDHIAATVMVVGALLLGALHPVDLGPSEHPGQALVELLLVVLEGDLVRELRSWPLAAGG